MFAYLFIVVLKVWYTCWKYWYVFIHV